MEGQPRGLDGCERACAASAPVGTTACRSAAEGGRIVGGGTYAVAGEITAVREPDAPGVAGISSNPRTRESRRVFPVFAGAPGGGGGGASGAVGRCRNPVARD